MATDNDITTHFYPNRDHSIAYAPYVRESVYEQILSHMTNVFDMQSNNDGPNTNPIQPDKQRPNYKVSAAGPVVVALLFIVGVAALVVKLLMLLKAGGNQGRNYERDYE